MSNTVLFIFEGEKTEPQILKNFKKTFFKKDSEFIFYATYNSNIYQLYNQIKKDEFLDILELLKERNDKNKSKLQNIEREAISEVYLFFDYDGHVPIANNNIIKNMLHLFNEETENGKLYISYPMVESLKHFNESNFSICFNRCMIKINLKSSYKKLVSEESDFTDVRKLDKVDWLKIMIKTIKKSNCLIENEFILPSYIKYKVYTQDTIFKNQLRKFVIPRNEVMILSGFPFFVIDFFGEGIFKEMIQNSL